MFSARETEMAERRKAIELIGAAQEAERDALRHPDRRRGARGWRPRPRRRRARTRPRPRPRPSKIRVAGVRLRHEIEAEGVRPMNEAQNMLTPESRAARPRACSLIDKLEGIIRESVRPMEKIEGIKILHVDGLGGAAAAAGAMSTARRQLRRQARQLARCAIAPRRR